MNKKSFVTRKDAVNVFALAIFIPAVVSLIISFFLVFSGKSEADVSSWLLLVLAQVCIIAAGGGYILFKKFDVKQINGLNKPPKVLNTFLIILLPLALILFVNPIQNLFVDLLVKAGYSPKPDSFDFASFNGWELVASVILVCILPALGEEFVYRGLVLEGFRKKRMDFTAIIISAVLFAIMHKSIEQTIHPFLMGLVFGFVYCATGSLWNAVLLHFLNNLYVVIFSAVEEAGAFISDNWWLMFVGLACAAAILFYIWKTRDKSEFNLVPEKTEKKSSEQILLLPALAYCLVVWVFGVFS